MIYAPNPDSILQSHAASKNGIQVRIDNPAAELPRKAHADDVGWDLTLIGRADNVEGDQVGQVTVFETGLALAPTRGGFLLLCARSSLYKQGYMMPHVGIIDPGYTGEIKVPLQKFREGPDLELPFRGAQVVLLPCLPSVLIQAPNLPATERGAGAFGSSGVGYDDDDVPRHARARRAATRLADARASNQNHLF